MKKKIIMIGSALLIVVLISVQLIANKSKVEERKSINNSAFKTVTVNTAIVVREEQDSKLKLVGTTAARNEVLVQSQGNGEIVKINFKLGDYVTKGKVLAVIDDRLASLALEKARLQLSRAEDEYNKEKNLYSGKASTENQLRDSRIDFENAKIAVEQAKKQLEFTRISAPQNGYIVEKFIERGSLVNTGVQIVRIADISQLKINVNVSEADVYKIKNGMKITAVSSVYPGVEYSGSVSFVNSKGDQAHNYSVEVSIANNSSHPLKAGTFTSVEFDLASKLNVLLIPREAVIGSIKDAVVFAVRDNKAYKKTVTIGRDFGNSLEVLNGLNEGETIVTTGQINLTNGSPIVTIKNQEGLK